MAIWLGHRIKVFTTHVDLDNIDKTYTESEKGGFWVAELISDESNAIKTPQGNLDFPLSLLLLLEILNFFVC